MLLTLMAQSDTIPTEAAVSSSPAPFWDTPSIVVSTIGLSILVIWLCWYGGFGSLRHAPVRRNRLFLFLPMLIFSFWLILEYVAVEWVRLIFDGFRITSLDTAIYVTMTVLRIWLIVMMLVIAHRTFARRLKGFGLNFRTVGKDAGLALIYLAAVYPLILIALWIVTSLGRLVAGDGFDVQTHESLTFLSETDGFSLRLLIVFFAVIVVPVFEEMLFRGFFQTMLRSLTQNAWLSIIVNSALFAITHYPNWTHMPSLFILSCGLGYAYERSGSLLRPILMHIFFNGLSIGMMLLTPS